MAFGDRQLDRLVELALANNPDLAVARARLETARGLSRVAGAPLVPRADLTGQVGRAHWSSNQFFPPPFGGTQTWDNAINLTAAYSLDLWGGNRAAAQAAQDQVAQRLAERDAARLLLTTDLVRVYLRYAQACALRSETAAMAAHAETRLRIEMLRLRHGLTDADRVNRAEAQRAAYEQNERSIAGEIRLLAVQLAVLSGQGVSTAHPLQLPSIDLTASWHPPSHVPADLVGRRPDVQARRWQVAAAAQSVRMAQVAFYPNVDLTAYLGGLAAAGGFLTFLRSSSANYGVTPALSLPIFEGGRLRGQLRAQSGRYDEAVARYDQTLRTALQQVADALTRVQTLAQERDALRRQRAAAEADRQIAQRRYDAGLTNRLPVLSAADAVLQVDRKMTALNAQALDALTVLFAGLGGAVISHTLPNDGQRS